MPAQESFYDILGVSRTATSEEIKKAFRKLAKDNHPDHGGDEERFKKMSEAYETLSDPKKRKEYDELSRLRDFGYGRGSGGGGYTYQGQGGSVDWGDLGDIFSNIRSGYGVAGDWSGSVWDSSPRPRRGSDLTISVEIGFDEALSGSTRKVTYRIPSNREQQSLTVKIPAGAVDGGKLRYHNRGEYGENGGQRGDLVVTTKISPHPVFSRDGANVTAEIPITPAEAVLGAQLDVPTPQGGKVRLKVPAGTQDGKVFRMSGLGAPDVKAKGKTGDYLLTAHVVIPHELSEEQRQAYETLLEHEDHSLREKLQEVMK